MMKKHLIPLLFLLALPAFFFLSPAGYAQKPAEEAPDAAALLQDTTGGSSVEKPAKDKLAIPANYPRICRRYAQLLSSRHFLQKPLDEKISAQAWTNFISYLDYDRSYFLQADIDSFEPWRLKLSACLEKGDFEFPLKVFKRYRQRVSERTDFSEKLLDKGFDFTIEEDYVWKRKDAPWPADAKEQDDLWRRRVKNDVLARMIVRDYAESNKVAKASSTNALPAVASNRVASAALPAKAAPTNAVPALAPTNAIPDMDLSPDAFVRKRYRQFQIIISDADAEWVLQRYLSAFAAAYDPHTAYMAPAAVDDFNIDMNLTLCGIGATLTAEDGAAKIVEIIPGSPAGRDTRDIRLKKNDKIIGVGQGDGPIEDVIHQPLDKIVKRIRGKKGTKVVLQVVSASDPSGAAPRLIDLIRDDIKLEEQAATGMVIRVSSPYTPSAPAKAPSEVRPNDGERKRAFGVIRLPTFYGSMTSDFNDPNFRSCTFDIMKIISKMNHEIEGLVLDLRGNGGGSLREAVTLAGSFIRMGPIVIVQEIGVASALPDRDPAIGFRKPMIVLVDRASASASEIVAAALQDYGRAVIVGDHKTHGKGSVQTILPLMASDPSYGSIRLTCAKFFRINGGSTQLHGVESDIVLPSTLEYLDIGEDKLPNAMPWTSIRPSRYSSVYNIKPIISKLATNAFARLAGDKEYQDHLELVDHVKEISERTSVPLSYAARYKLFAAEQEMDKADDLAEEEEGDGDKAAEADWTEGDVVLRATLDILADLVDIQGASGISASDELVPPDWLFKLFQ